MRHTRQIPAASCAGDRQPDRVGGTHTHDAATFARTVPAFGPWDDRAATPCSCTPSSTRTARGKGPYAPVAEDSLLSICQTKARPGSGRVPDRGVACPATRASCLVGRSLHCSHQDFLLVRATSQTKPPRRALLRRRGGVACPCRVGVRYRAMAPAGPPASVVTRCDSSVETTRAIRRGWTSSLTGARQLSARTAKAGWRVTASERIADRLIEDGELVAMRKQKSRRRCSERCFPHRSGRSPRRSA
jgi:hypothetical protein